MLFNSIGQQFGLLSGGCLEANIQLRAAQVMSTQKSITLCYDGADEDEIHEILRNVNTNRDGNIMVDENGTLVDGDQLLYLIMQFYIKEGYEFGGVVGTHMTNLAFEEKCKSQSISFARANVGDRYVSEELNRRKWILGGENSGHILVKNLHSTGDGIISALQVLSYLVKNKKSLKSALTEIQLYPQILINIPVSYTHLTLPTKRIV